MSKTVHYIGLDVHKETIAVAIAPAGDTEVRHYGVIGGKVADIDNLIKKLQKPGVELHFVYEAGPCGYVICRHLAKKEIACSVVAPSLVPKKSSDRVKTDRRDAEQLARLYRAGELTPIYVPDEEDEAIRDLVRARNAAVADQRKFRQRLKGFLLRLDFRYKGTTSWNDAHLRYLASLKMPRPAQQIVFQEYLDAITDATNRLERLTAAVKNALPGWKREAVVRALMTLRGFQEVAAMTVIAEAGDLTRFDDPRQLMAYFGLVPSEHTTGDKRVQGSITKCGNGACRRVLVEAGWQYRFAPKVSPQLRERQEKQPRAIAAISWKAQQRLHHRFNVLTRHRKKSVVVAAAVARELAGFVWAIACQLSAPEKLNARKPAAAQPAGRDYALDAAPRKLEKTSKGLKRKSS